MAPVARAAAFLLKAGKADLVIVKPAGEAGVFLLGASFFRKEAKAAFPMGDEGVDFVGEAFNAEAAHGGERGPEGAGEGEQHGDVIVHQSPSMPKSRPLISRSIEGGTDASGR